ncbi:MAG: hypothetical protein IJ503_00335 [Akkermansia sp.]|nr:hypothetical protein [Akkermansia sp.]
MDSYLLCRILIGLIGAVAALVGFTHEEWLERNNPKFALGVLLIAVVVCCFGTLILTS